MSQDTTSSTHWLLNPRHDSLRERREAARNWIGVCPDVVAAALTSWTRRTQAGARLADAQALEWAWHIGCPEAQHAGAS